MIKNKMRYIVFLMAIFVMVFSCGCGKKTGRADNKSDVEQLLEDAKADGTSSEVEIEGTEVLNTTSETEISDEAAKDDTQDTTGNVFQQLDGTNGQYEPTMVTGEVTTEFPLADGPSQTIGVNGGGLGHENPEEEAPLEEADPTVDVDLTVLTSNMVYAQVYNIMMSPEDYLGKKIKASGTYYPLFYEGTGKYYHYVMIQDALACCQNGIEFIWDDGTHVYPDEYPKENQMIEIVGVFKQYEEEGYIYHYLEIQDYEIIQ